ncbi:MAG: hypothetical protein A3B65_00875 [Acidobacteria bacterium RIFCSPHIGHO2_02_FULL_67_57]|nr:MAG: hypothetical protein A3B65_00875 [Acidobacteria bacterium RIFCSPHIGHO2_02_FULL_67_57]
MVYVTELWLPIVLSAVAVFVVSFIIHMLLPYHKSDYKKLPNEENLLEVLRKASVTPGTYFFPHCMSHKEMKSPEVMEKFKKGPVGLMTVIPSGPPMLPKHLVQWFVYSLVISFFVAYLTGRTVAAGAEYLAVFRVAGTVAFLGYAAAHATDSIWKGEAWSTTLKHMFDGLLYGLFTAGVFGWLWPR